MGAYNVKLNGNCSIKTLDTGQVKLNPLLLRLPVYVILAYWYIMMKWLLSNHVANFRLCQEIDNKIVFILQYIFVQTGT